jgi:hypothetical protein
MPKGPVIPDKLERWPVDRLVPYERNARTHSPEQLAQIAASIVEFGFTNPILVASDAGIIAGHGRLEAAKQLGLAEVPVVVLDHLTPAQRRAYVIADNQLALISGWDDELLKNELAELGELEFDLTLLGWGENLPTFESEVDLSALDELEDPTDQLADGVMKALQIEFRPEDYEEAKALVTAARKRGDYVGMKLIEALAS